jgi:DNA-directed RNA polymerase specialized sigma24 family protein
MRFVLGLSCIQVAQLLDVESAKIQETVRNVRRRIRRKFKG